MDVSRIIDPLNTAQRDAVTAESANTLVLAGAGSGKTRVLAHRVAWLIETRQASPHGILAVTFTNKAAAEMRGRIEALMASPPRTIWVGTFHGIAHRLLRRHWQETGLPQNFQIIDGDDQLRLIRRAIRHLELDEALWAPREAQWFINARKEEGLRAQHLDGVADPHAQTLIKIYRAYEERCAGSGLVDFGELLLRAHELWRHHPEVLAHYRQRFPQVLVDEFQDTNAIQYAWLRQLTGTSGKLFVVGDDDQSIYGWRGARVEHMQKFQKDFESVRLVRLEQNYRSTATILQAANAVIANNSSRLGKELWTDGAAGAPIILFTAFNEQEEARYCVERIKGWQEHGRRYDDHAILYRTSAQSRVFEEALRQRGIPYRVYGGFRFYERAEIKDVLAYLRLIAWREDDAAFERVVNTPNRGIGQRSLDIIRGTAKRAGTPLWRAAQAAIGDGALGTRGAAAVNRFLSLIENLSVGAMGTPLGTLVKTVITETGLEDHYRKEKTAGEIDRLENLEELVRAAGDYIAVLEEGADALTEFLAIAALEAGEGQANDYEDSVQLMTLHSAKGLEFRNVFLVGLEEGLFPHQRCSDDATQLEEERRLCYVGLTRAKEKLIITHAETRRLQGTERRPQPSRFIAEMPAELIAEVRLGTVTMPPRVQRSEYDAAFRLGQRVVHAKFGEGIVLRIEGEGQYSRVQVNFAQAGAKWLVASYAGLRPV
ncbi:MAG: DNA helicase II [Pseudomonadota bacterium]|nr:DNA helicase II [Pseudomonadota bacterium]